MSSLCSHHKITVFHTVESLILFNHPAVLGDQESEDYYSHFRDAQAEVKVWCIICSKSEAKAGS